MNKKLIALAVAGVFALPVTAMADSGNVKISGKIDMSVDSLNGANHAGTDLTRETNVSSNASNITVSGTESLGYGLKAVWRVSSFVNMGADDGQNGWATNDSFVGLKGGFGTVRLGNLSTPMKIISRKVDLFGNHLGDSRNLVSKVTKLVYAPPPAKGKAIGVRKHAMGWDLRTKNTVAYSTPDFGGFTANVAYSTNTNAGFATDKTMDVWSGSGIYKNGPIFVGLAYEKHNLSSAGSYKVTLPNNTTMPVNPQDEHAWRLGAGVMFGPAKVVALYQKANDIGGFSDADRNVWGLGGAYKMGRTTLKAQYYKASDIGDVGNTGASMWALGVDHHMSKRTMLYVAYASTRNDNGSATTTTGAAYSAFGGGHGDNPGTVAGKNPSGFSLGMVHKF